MTSLEKAAALDLLSEADNAVFEEDSADFALDIWEGKDEEVLQIKEDDVLL